MPPKVYSQDIPAAEVSRHMPNQPFPANEFADVLAANAKYETGFENQHLTGTAAKGLAIITLSLIHI
jgi:hypothetical protein